MSKTIGYIIQYKNGTWYDLLFARKTLREAKIRMEEVIKGNSSKNYRIVKRTTTDKIIRNYPQKEGERK
jgi:hypothetical protein